MKFNLNQQFSLSGLYPNLDLPKIWQLSYHEGIRHNHILFRPEEMERIRKTLQVDLFKFDKSDAVLLLKKSTRIFTSDDFQFIRKQIEGMNTKELSVFFILYKRALTRWSLKLKNSLN